MQIFLRAKTVQVIISCDQSDVSPVIPSNLAMMVRIRCSDLIFEMCKIPLLFDLRLIVWSALSELRVVHKFVLLHMPGTVIASLRIACIVIITITTVLAVSVSEISSIAS